MLDATLLRLKPQRKNVVSSVWIRWSGDMVLRKGGSDRHGESFFLDTFKSCCCKVKKGKPIRTACVNDSGQSELKDLKY